MVSATGVKGDPVTLAGEGPVALPIEIGIRFRCRARRNDRGVLQPSFGLTDAAANAVKVRYVFPHGPFPVEGETEVAVE